MTELVCLFVILYALSAALNKNVQAAAKQVQEMMDQGQMKGSVKVDNEGLHITLQEQGMASFFESGSSEATAEIDAMLSKLAPALRKLSEQNDIIIEGHTDNQPISNQYFDSNWELSTARATAVARLLIEKYRLPAARMGAIGYGEHRPIALNDRPENRAKNRRVVFFVKNSPQKPAPAAAAAPSKAH
ncbi:MAG: flagellar motor protein MotB [Elusimicrobia bacterium]|nr:flagellar motor protein MotB [Elusimicrobiota bacterium]